jgi:dipeptidyl-peptidase-4
MIKPPNFRFVEEVSILFHVYGEPAGQTVVDRAARESLWHQMLAQAGYLVASVDNRGTPAPRGRAWRKKHLSGNRLPFIARPGGGGAGDRTLALC